MRRRLLAVTAAALIGAAGCGSAGSGPAPTPGPVSPSPSATPVTGPYAALGDSYTSGLRIPPQGGTPQGCARSGVNYPSLVARRLELKDFTDVSCSGARTGDLTAAQQTDGGANPPQLDAVGAATRLVTLGIGGNDAGFLDVLGRCAVENLRNSLADGGADAPCRAYYTTGTGRGEVQRRLATAGDRLGGALDEIKRRAPRARVLVVGYPALLPQDPAGCATTLGTGVAPADIAFVAEQERQLNAMLQQRAETAGAAFVDTYAASSGHDMCAAEGERWIEPLSAAPGLAPVHPNARGQQGMATAVLASLEQR
ncbi:GDSL-type esterase/lipase family protein [Kitasatospora sp. NPDC088134]|uniref:SGNH/GDSL hydrolase family protein n=1 Tax=Kitasatospora sp. NPDC088134 TaxID=3364071 RepID=UPI00382D09A1